MPIIEDNGDVLLASDTGRDGTGRIVFSTEGVERAGINADGTGTGLLGGSLPIGNRVWSIGDSITLADGGSSPLTFGSRNWQMWAQLYCNSRLYMEGIAATSGYTTAQVLATHLPTVLAAAPNACFVLAGTNDVSTTGAVPASTLTNLTSIYQQLVAARIVPILCSVPPRLTYVKAPETLNAWLSRYARRHGYPFVDFYSVLVDGATGGYLSGLDNGDGLHPGPLGAKAMGNLIATTLQLQLSFPVSAPWLTGNNGDTSVMLSNPLFLTDTNADGIPDQWSLLSGAGTFALATDASIAGNKWTLTRGASDATLATGYLTSAPGDVISVAWRMKITTPSTGVFVRFQEQTSSGVIAAPLNAWAGTDDNWRTYYTEFTMPSGKSNVRMRLELQGASAQIVVAQPTMLNLTSLGIAS